MVRNSISHSTKPRLRKIFLRTDLFLLCFYLLIGLCGYFSFGDKVINYSLILERPPLNGSNDIFMKIGIILVSFLTYIGYITHVIPIKL